MTEHTMPLDNHNETIEQYVKRLQDYAQSVTEALARATKDADHFFKLSGEYLDKLEKAEADRDEKDKQLASCYNRMENAERRSEEMRKLLSECRQYVSANHIHEIPVLNGEIQPHDCARCKLRDEIDAIRAMKKET